MNMSGETGGGGETNANAANNDEGKGKKRKKDMRIYEKITDKFMEAAPTSGNVDWTDLQKKGWLFPMICAYAAVWIFCMVWFSVTGAISDSNKHYLSITKPDGAICSEIGNPLIAKFGLDTAGYFNTHAAYKTNTSIYVLEFKGATISTAQYKSSMASFAQKLKLLGETGAQRDLPYSIVAWSSFSFSDATTNMQFYSNVDAAIIFNSWSVNAVTLSTAQLRCSAAKTPSTPVAVTASFNTAKKGIEFRIPYKLSSDFDQQNGTWPSTANPQPCGAQNISIDSLFGYSPRKFPGDFSFVMDIRTTLVAIALNTGILKASDLSTVDLGGGPVTSLGLPEGLFLVDSHYTPMDLIFCLDRKKYILNDGPDVCFYPVQGSQGYNLVYPVMSSAYNAQYNAPCQCPTDANDQACNSNTLLLQYMFDIGDWNLRYGDNGARTLRNDRMVDIGLKLQRLAVASNDEAIGSSAWNVGFHSILNYYYANQQSGSLVTRAFEDFCQGYCGSFALFLSPGGVFVPMNQYVTPLSYLSTTTYDYSGYTYDSGEPLPATLKATRLMCLDLLNLPGVMDTAKLLPPVPLVEPFFDCHNRFDTAFLSTVGVAQGNATLATSFFMIISTFLLTKWLNYRAPSKAERILTPHVKEKRRNRHELHAQAVTYNLLDTMARELVELRALLHAAAPSTYNKYATGPSVLDNKYVEFKFSANAGQADVAKETPPPDFAQEVKGSLPKFGKGRTKRGGDSDSDSDSDSDGDSDSGEEEYELEPSRHQRKTEEAPRTFLCGVGHL